MRDQAIRNTHPTVTTINAEIDAWDAQGQTVILDEAKIAAEITKLQAAHVATQYQRDRAKAYPDFREYLDGIVKGDQAQVDTYIAACLAVKARYPK